MKKRRVPGFSAFTSGTPTGAEGKGKAEERLDALLLEGLKGEATEMTGADWQAIRQEVISQVKPRETQR